MNECTILWSTHRLLAMVRARINARKRLTARHETLCTNTHTHKCDVTAKQPSHCSKLQVETTVRYR